MKSMLAAALVLAGTLSTHDAAAFDVTLSEVGGVRWTMVCDASFGCYSNQTNSGYYQASTSRPPGTTTQWINFWFMSDDYISTMSMGDHWGIGLRGYWDGGTDLRGRGMIAGITTNPDGCTVGVKQPRMQAQVESFANQGQGIGLFPETCSPALDEDTLYDITLTVNDAQYIQYEIRNPYTNQVIYASPAVYDPSFIDNSITGWFIGNVTYSVRNWSLHFMNITYGWY